MNRINTVLAVAALACAGLTVHYARAVKLQRAENVRALESINLQPTPPHAERTDNPGSNASITPAATGDSEDSPPENRFKPVIAALARHHLEELRDPQARAQRKKAILALFDEMKAFAPRIGLTGTELDQYLEARAERALVQQQRQLECQVDAACDYAAYLKAKSGSTQQFDLELLGPEKYARMKAVQGASQERFYLTRLSERLPTANSLVASQIESLSFALADERDKFKAEAKQNRQEIRSHGFDGIEMLSMAAPRSPDEYRQRAETATRYSQRLYDRAAASLTDVQLAEFRTRLDRHLADQLENLREDELRRDAREAARK